MNPTREHLRALLPHLNEKELDSACERFTRYIRLAAETASKDSHVSVPSLTPRLPGANVNLGQVDPGTSKNTG
jgi:hypothetical protein